MRSSLQGLGIGVLILVLLGVGGYFAFRPHAPVALPPKAAPVAAYPTSEVVGSSVEGRAVTAYTYGTGSKHLLLVGGIHGGYEWNAVLLAYQLMDYLKANPSVVPASLAVTIIPDLNPDGVFKVVGKEGVFTPADVSKDKTVDASGRFNADVADLNRNFDCNWQATSTWQSRTVSAGTAAFSEPEASAFRDYVLAAKPVAVVFWHSAAGGVFASHCGSTILPGTLDLMSAYAQASKYPAMKSFDAYPISGAADDWLSSVGIAAVSVELKTHESVEWEQNLAGVKALFDLYNK